MNIEFETKSVLRGGFTPEEKVHIIHKFANFKEEHILMALKAKFESENDKYSQIYGELVRLSKYGGKNE
jgi:hypothetical protein